MLFFFLLCCLEVKSKESYLRGKKQINENANKCIFTIFIDSSFDENFYLI